LKVYIYNSGIPANVVYIYIVYISVCKFVWFIIYAYIISCQYQNTHMRENSKTISNIYIYIFSILISIDPLNKKFSLNSTDKILE